MALSAPRGRGKIRPPRKGLGGATFDFETNWAVLERAFHEIHTKNASALSFEELYRNAYNIVLRQKGAELYERVTGYEERWLDTQIRTHIVQQLTPALLVGDSSSLATSAEKRVAGEGFLRALKRAWEDHQLCMGMLTDVLMYMVRSGVSLWMTSYLRQTGPRLLYRLSQAFHLRKVYGRLSRPDPKSASPNRNAQRAHNIDSDHTRSDPDGSRWREDRSLPHQSQHLHARRSV